MFPLGIIMLLELTIPAETIFGGCGYRGYRCAQPTAKHGLSPVGDIWRVRIADGRATSQSPLQLRDVTRGVFFVDVIFAYFVDLQYAM